MAFDPISGLFEIGNSIINKIFPDKEAAAKAKLELMKLQQNGEFKELEARFSAITTEAQSSDPWTSRARPSFMYVIYIYILSALPMGVLFAFNPEVATNVTIGVKAWLESIPGDLYALFGAGYLGYGAYRSYDKKLKK